MKLLILLGMSFLVKVVVPEWVCVWIGLVITFAINALECMWTWFFLLSFEMKRVSFEVSFAALTKVIVVFRFVGSITFNTSRPLEMACKYSVVPLLAVFTLWDAGVHISSSYWSDETFYVKALVDDFLGQRSILWVLDVDPNNSHIRLE